ncbi:hypothetical protein [Polycladidibacter hongkongensis]|uniref:hypothetical protein n=1 Tax=Polycladidibacter hongkongensis TaxID=1647556 RepID=UPI000835D432|nr:hypothetical protein [Pseudovibrio hongkongensis]
MSSNIVHIGNGVDQGKLKSAVDRILEVQGQIDSEKAKYMKLCKDLKEDIKDIKQQAKDAGIPPKQLNGILKRHELYGKYDAIRTDMDEDDAELLDQMELSLGWAVEPVANDNTEAPEAA